MEDILKHFAGNEGEDGRLNEIREQTNTEDLADDLTEQAEAQKNGTADSPAARKSAEELSDRLNELADELEKERERLTQSRLDQLSQLEAETRRLQEEAKAEAEAESAAQAEAEAEAGAEGEAEVEGSAQASSEPSESESPGAGASSGNGGGPQGQGSGQNGTGGNDIAELAQELARANDPELERIASSLNDTLGQLPDNLESLGEAQKRLLVLLDELIKRDFPDTGEGKIPLVYKRTVEDYFRALSDDFADDPSEETQ